MSSRRNAASDRRSEFKFHGLTAEELRRRREETTVEIRKAKREDSLNKRRNLNLPSSIQHEAPVAQAAVDASDEEAEAHALAVS